MSNNNEEFYDEAFGVSDDIIEPFITDNITLENWEGFRRAIKRPIAINVCQINFPEGFSVTTLEGVMTGKPGDYLIIGVNKEKYICKKEIFEKTYDFIEE